MNVLLLFTLALSLAALMLSLLARPVFLRVTLQVAAALIMLSAVVTATMASNAGQQAALLATENTLDQQRTAHVTLSLPTFHMSLAVTGQEARCVQQVLREETSPVVLTDGARQRNVNAVGMTVATDGVPFRHVLDTTECVRSTVLLVTSQEFRQADLAMHGAEALQARATDEALQVHAQTLADATFPDETAPLSLDTTTGELNPPPGTAPVTEDLPVNPNVISTVHYWKLGVVLSVSRHAGLCLSMVPAQGEVSYVSGSHMRAIRLKQGTDFEHDPGAFEVRGLGMGGILDPASSNSGCPPSPVVKISDGDYETLNLKLNPEQ